MSARCYCGATRLEFATPPLTSAYCHCSDCRRWTGAAVAAFVAFTGTSLRAHPPLDAPRSHAPGVARWNCTNCHSPLAAQFDYLPGHVYVPLGIMDDIEALAPSLHCHADGMPSWLHIADDLPRSGSTGRDALNKYSS